MAYFRELSQYFHEGAKENNYALKWFLGALLWKTHIFGRHT